MDETCKNWEAIDAVKETVKASESLEAQYDIKTAIEDIKLYVNHLIRGAQRQKAKAFAFDSLDGASCFWLKNYCQKIPPMKYRVGRIEYFGKKRRTPHVDIVFSMVNMKLQKDYLLHTYTNCRSRCKKCPGTSRQHSEKTSS